MPTSKKPTKKVTTPETSPVSTEVAAQPSATPTTTPANPFNLDIVHDHISIVEYSSTSYVGALTVADAKKMLGWETEKDHMARMMREKPGSKSEEWSYGDVYHCLDIDKEKIRCWANAGNRPFNMRWCEALIQTDLSGQWAGPLTIPGETINGETIRISRYGRVLSGQHQLTALVLADERLLKSRAQDLKKYPFWDGHEHVVIETLVITGLSEDERVLRTIDYVKPRTEADMLYTMSVFQDSTPTERRDLTKMLASGRHLLWERTDTKGYETHPEVVGFLERHERLIKCVEHLFTENRARADGGRRISKLHLSAGHCAALCYLMGCSGPGTDGDVYRNGDPPGEKWLDWSRWDLARLFWANLASHRSFGLVREALCTLRDGLPSQGLGGIMPEKLAILAAAWERWNDRADTPGDPFDALDRTPGGILCLSYTDLDEKGQRLPGGEIDLVNVADFGGIDCPEAAGRSRAGAQEEPMPVPPTREEILALGEAARTRHAAKK